MLGTHAYLSQGLFRYGILRELCGKRHPGERQSREAWGVGTQGFGSHRTATLRGAWLFLGGCPAALLSAQKIFSA